MNDTNTRHTLPTISAHPDEQPRCSSCRYAYHWHVPAMADLPEDDGWDCEYTSPHGRDGLPTDGEGIDRPCRYWQPWEDCKTHPGNKVDPSASFGCPQCDEEGYAAEADMAADIERAAAEWARDNA